MSEVKLETPEASKEPTEGMRLAEMLFKRTTIMVGDYRTLLQGKGGLLTASMTSAYNKGLSDALKLILKEMDKQNGKK